MVNVDIDAELYEQIKIALGKHKYEYPSVKFFVQKAVVNELKSLSPEEDAFAAAKKLLSQYPELVKEIEQLPAKKIKEALR